MRGATVTVPSGGGFPYWAHMLCIASSYFGVFGCVCTSRGLPDLQTEEEEQSQKSIAEHPREMSRRYISPTLCTSYMWFFVFVSESGGGVLKDSGAVCFSQQRRKPAGISRLLLPSASYYFSKQVQSASWWLGGYKPSSSCRLFPVEKKAPVSVTALILFQVLF